MTKGIPESDWKSFRSLYKTVLERFCERVLTEVKRLSSDEAQTAHERYSAIYRLMRERDKILADIFDRMSRSSALLQLTLMNTYGLLAEDEMQQFSEETRRTIQRLI